MEIALVQVASTTAPEENLRTVEREVAAAAEAGAEVVVFPEAMMSRFGGVPLVEVAEPVDGPWADGVRRVAERHGVVVVAGMFTPGEGERVRNTLLATGPGVEAAYDKIHLFDAFGFAESDTVTPGDRTVCVEVGGIVLGLATCYDLRFPALFQALADAGASAVVVPASWGAGPSKREQWEVLVRARALDSTCFVLACDQADPTTAGLQEGPGPTGIGASLAAGPDGSVLGSLGAAPGSLLVEVTGSVVDDVRAQLPVLANRRL